MNDKAIEAAFEEWWKQSRITPSGHYYATDNKVAAKQAWEAAYQAASGEARAIETLCHIANIEHCGGLIGITPMVAGNLIRRLTIPYWDKSGTDYDFRNRVQAAIDAAIAAREGE